MKKQPKKKQLTPEQIALKSAEAEFKRYRKQAANAAEDLGYDDAVVESIKAAENIGKINTIMKEARKAFWEARE